MLHNLCTTFRNHEKDEMHDWMHKLERHIMNREVNEHVSTIKLNYLN